MKKRIAGILISILALSALSGCGKEKDISYVDEPATTSDAATASVLHRNYEVTDGLLTFTVDGRCRYLFIGTKLTCGKSLPKRTTPRRI